MSVRIQLRRDTAANWASANPTLTQGEPGYETDTGKIKYGDGSTAWNSLAYAALQTSGGALTGDLTLNAQSDLRFADSDSSNWVAFQGPATVSSNVTWTLPNADGTANQVLSTNGSGTLSWATAATGKISQVVSTTKTDTFSSTINTTWTDITGLSASITPSSSSSKILAFASIHGALFRPTENAVLLRLVRDSTAISVGDAAGSRSRVSFGASKVSNDSIASASINFLDSPATTSSVTYKIQFWQDTPGNPILINRTITDNDGVSFARSASVITLMEVAA